MSARGATGLEIHMTPDQEVPAAAVLRAFSDLSGRFDCFAEIAAANGDVDGDDYRDALRQAGRCVIAAYESGLLDQVELEDVIDRYGREAARLGESRPMLRPCPESLFAVLAGGYLVGVSNHPTGGDWATTLSTGGVLAERFPGVFSDTGPPSDTWSEPLDAIVESTRYRSTCHHREAVACRLLADLVTELTFKPAGWWLSSTDVPISRLQKASESKRQSKRVRSKVIDGAKCYCVEDGHRCWPSEMEKTQRI